MAEVASKTASNAGLNVVPPSTPKRIEKTHYSESMTKNTTRMTSTTSTSITTEEDEEEAQEEEAEEEEEAANNFDSSKPPYLLFLESDSVVPIGSPASPPMEQNLYLDAFSPLYQGPSDVNETTTMAVSNADDTTPAEPKLPMIGLHRIGPGLIKRRKKAILRHTQFTLQIIREHADADFVFHLRRAFGHSRLEPWKKPPNFSEGNRNPPWRVRIVAALLLNGAMKSEAIFDWILDVFRANSQKPDMARNVRAFSHSLSHLLIAKVVVFANNPKEQEFRLADSLLDKGMSNAMPVAFKIAGVYSHQLFLNILSDVEEVVQEMQPFKAAQDGDTISICGINAMLTWNELFPDANMAQMVTAAILFQGADKEEGVPISHVIQFVEDCFLEREIDIWTEKELVTTLNCLNSIGVLEGDIKTDGCKLCEDFELIRVLISGMFQSELFDLLPPPMNLSYRDLLVLTYYILDPQRKSYHSVKAERFMLQRFLSSSSNATSLRVSPNALSCNVGVGVGVKAKNAAILDGLLQDEPGFNCVLSEAMFEALDTRFKRYQEGLAT